ncbi:hypothetical protein ASE12_10915 [Aeromicrobium sp. Root236]|uniref:hypothetical protein n=1 Tax=Aeromicrobium sp. Root236 TaxID=1736498 RepID=UPI0006F1E33E|nr:hypothetical protein [Aeromicrobium sp. Root236]KRC65229.1 hypothetical protein ASE12_10915 [Aeromicrobium sp. Root236]
MDLQWGTIPDWVAAISTPIAIGALLTEAWRSRKQRAVESRERNDRAEAAEAERKQEQVARVTSWLQDEGKAVNYQNLTPVIDNASAMAIYDVVARIRGLAGEPPEEKRIRIIPPGTRSVAEPWLAIRAESDELLDVEIEFKDARGLRWLRRGAEYREITGIGSATA